MLAYCQEATMKDITVVHGMPGHRREDETSPSRQAHDKLLWQCKTWLDGSHIHLEDF